MKPILDIAGQRFGRLVALRLHPARLRGRVAWLCRCDCGNEFAVTSNSLRTGNTTSCGCRNREMIRARKTRLRHGHARTAAGKRSRTYETWLAMIARCERPTASDYDRYGGRGIVVDPRWHSFEAFLEDMGERPSPRHSIDRIDNDGPYTKANCRWATASEQNRNTRRSRRAAESAGA